jgi:tetratricopeptide (TPR) repeat protein
MELAQQLIQKSEFDQAVATLKQLKTDTHEKWRLLGVCYTGKKKPLIAVKCFFKAVALGAQYECRLNLCVALSMLGRHRQAKQICEVVLRELSEAGEQSALLDQAYYNLGVENEYIGDFAGSAAAFAKSALGQSLLPEIQEKVKSREEKLLKRI